MIKDDDEIDTTEEKGLEPEAEPMLGTTPMKLIPKEKYDEDKPPPYPFDDKKLDIPEAQPQVRETWDQKVDFLLAVIGFAVDLGNVWRFPYICYRNGGGAFLVPYFIMYIFGGLPLFYMELALGQYQRCGCISVWKRICPMFKGIGIAICISASYVAWYYNTIMAWALYFLFSSMRPNLPWMECDRSADGWATILCRTVDESLELKDNQTRQGLLSGNSTALDCLRGENCTLPSSEEFFFRSVLEIQYSDGIGNIGPIKWEIAVCLSIIFVIVYFSLWKGVKSSGKAVWITATLPYIVLVVLLVRGLMLEGSYDGVIYYLTPKWDRLLEIQVWTDAASQIFFSLGPGFGVLLALSSYNKFHNNCYSDAMITSAINCFTSFLAGFVVFSVLGHMSLKLGKKMEEIASEGPGLVFMAYPLAIGTLKGSFFWAILFFVMLITLGLDSTFGGLESIITGILDEFPKLRKRRELFVLVFIIYCFCGALPTTTYGGFYVLNLLDQHGAPISLLFVVCVEGIALCWFYGYQRFSNDVEKMIGSQPGIYWKICWTFVSPVFLMAIFIANCIFYETRPVEVMGKLIFFPPWAVSVGWVITLSSISMVPTYIVYKYIITEGTPLQRLKKMITPEELPPHEESMAMAPLAVQESSMHAIQAEVQSNNTDPPVHV